MGHSEYHTNKKSPNSVIIDSSSPMNISSHIFFIFIVFLNLCYIVVSDCDSCYMHHHLRKNDQIFQQQSNRFWEFDQISKTWVEIKLPYNLISCVNNNCKVVDSIQELRGDKGEVEVPKQREDDDEILEKNSYPLLRVRKRVSLTRMSETSIWVTGQSGSIYERFWNGVQWVIAPHDLHMSAGYAVSVFMVNQTILALSDSGFLFQLIEESQPYWVEFMPDFDRELGKEPEQISDIRFSSGVVSNDMEKIYFCTKNGSLLELHGIDPPRWVNHGQPPGAIIAAITDANTIRPDVLFTLSGAGGLYEYDKASKPPWKKHIHIHAAERSEKDNSLAAIRGCTLHGISGAYSASIFLLTKGGELVERRLHQRKWKWMVHGSPNGHPLSSITCTSRDENIGNSNSLYLTSATGFIFEYQIPKHSGSSQNQELKGNWFNHEHPPQAKLARAISGLQLQVGRMIFPLDDGRLAELHLSGFGGENFGPLSPTNTKRKSSLKYVWSILEAPESEGWNAEYCTEEWGPANCILGTKDEIYETADSLSTSRWRKDTRTQQNYLSVVVSDINGGLSKSDKDYKLMKSHFRLRQMQEGKSFFLVTDDGSTFEYLNTENVWFWLKHEHSIAMGGVVGNYNGMLFLVDENGSLFIRESSSNELAWINCTAMKKGKQVIGGPPWDGAPGQAPRAKPDDAMFFVSKTGRLLQFTVALRKFKWKDCKNPLSTKIASIADQEGFRENIVFVVGRNGRLYQYNKVTEVWHEHYQSQHLILKTSSGTTMRLSLKGSIFMLSEDGGLVEYRWSLFDGWSWIEHGTPYTNVTLVGAPGPAFGEEVFLIGSDGNVHMRYIDRGEWKWRDFGFPSYAEYKEANPGDDEVCIDREFEAAKKLQQNLRDDIYRHCNPKVTPTRAISFSEDSVVFELEDGRLGEMQRMEGTYWTWSRIIGTPTSLCMANFWAS